MKHHIKLKYMALSLGIFMASCKKLVEIPPPTGNITSSQVFATDQQATAAVAGLFSQMISNTAGGLYFGNGAITVDCGLSADELKIFQNQAIGNLIQFQNNAILTSNTSIYTNLWKSAYFTIYQANSIIDGLQFSTTVTKTVKIELIAEVKFVRAFCNFYLINLFGDVPLVNSINWRVTGSIPKTPVADVYQNIMADLREAQSNLSSNFTSSGDRILPTSWAATALLARVYLYNREWANAEVQASKLISNSSLFGLESDLNSVFLINSKEAIWQLQQQIKQGNTFSSTAEGYQLIPRVAPATTQPYVYLTTPLLNAFETGDARRLNWVKSTVYAGNTYYYPYKYKAGSAQINNPYTEYYMVLRLAEQYLIRAEARAEQDKLTGANSATEDLNTIRNRALLPNYAGATDRTSILNAIYHERQIELFAEWGHRWLDLKRTGLALTTLNTDKGITISNNALLYPIPLSELTTDPNLTQNAGY